MMYFPRFKTLMFAAGFALLPACGMEEDPSSQNPLKLGQTRDELALGTETTALPARGGYGGVANALSCPANHVAVGIHGTVVTYVNSIGLLCQALNTDGTLGAASSTAMAGPGWGSPFSVQCPAGMAVVGFPGRGGELIDGLGLHCAAPGAWMNSTQVQASVAEVGSYSGNPFSDVCPQERVVTQLVVRTGDNLDMEQGVCTRMRATPPASCQDIKSANPSAANGAYTLYVGGDVSKPWTAWCHNMAGTPAEYLSLPSTGASVNFSQYTAGVNNGAGSTNVRTLFTKIRIDPITLRVNTGDQTFSTSSGQLNHGGPVTSMSYAAAMNCDFGNPGLGNVDLRGTTFAVAANQFAVVGSYPSGEAIYSSDSQVVNLWGRGDCGWNSVVGADHPFNGRAASLQLQYTTLTPPPAQPTQPTSGSFTFSASNTNSATQNTTPFEVSLTAGQTLQFGTCSVAGASGTGDTVLRLYAPDGSNVAANDDACGLLSFVGYTATQTGTYRIQAGCYSSGGCGGTVAFTIQ
jgi:hypothetical protein